MFDFIFKDGFPIFEDWTKDFEKLKEKCEKFSEWQKKKPLFGESCIDCFDKIGFEEYELGLAIPGYDENSIEVKINPSEKTVTVSGKILEAHQSCIAQDLMFDFKKVFRIPVVVDYSTFEKRVKNGILVIKAKLIKTIVEDESFYI